MKNFRDDRHERQKNNKFRDGGKKHFHEPLTCAECGKDISNREDHQNEGLCDDCFDKVIKGIKE